MTFSNLSNVIPGDYTVGITGNNGFETETRTKKLKIYATEFEPVGLLSPFNNQDTVATTVTLDWDDNSNNESFTLQVSLHPNFSTFLVNESNILNSNYTLTALSEATNYYWRVLPSNRCGSASASNATIFSFRTGVLTCGYSFTALDFTDAIINTTANSIATVPIQVPSGILIGDINVELNITHTYIQDFICTLEGPASIGSPIITLFNQPCGANNDINCLVDDSGSSFTCSATSPAVSGVVKPVSDLSALNGLNPEGTWILRVEDLFNGDGGSINSVTLYLCNIEQSLSTNDFLFSNVSIYPNPTNDFINITLSEKVTNETNFVLYDIQGRSIVEKNTRDNFTRISTANLTEGVYLLSIKNGGLKTTKKIVVKR